MNSSNYKVCFPFGNDGISPPGKLSPPFATRPGFYYYDWDWELLPAVAGIVVLFVASSLKLLLLFLLASYPWPFEFIPPGSFVLFWDYPPVPTAFTASVRDGPSTHIFNYLLIILRVEALFVPTLARNSYWKVSCKSLELHLRRQIVTSQSFVANIKLWFVRFRGWVEASFWGW